MLSKDDIIKILNDEDILVDRFILDAFIKNWKIEAIYEDENGVEFFEEVALEKIKDAMKTKEPENKLYTVEETTKEPEPPLVEEEKNIESQQTEAKEAEVVAEEIKPAVIVEEAKNLPEKELKNFTLDITSQTLSALAQSIAEKITVDISSYLKKNEWLEDALDAVSFKKDNEQLAAKIKELLEDNKIFIRKIKELEAEKSSYIKVFGNIYIKK